MVKNENVLLDPYSEPLWGGVKPVGPNSQLLPKICFASFPNQAYHANAAEDSVGANPGKDVAWQTSQGSHDQEKVHHQLDEEDHKDGYVEVGEGQTLGDGSPEAV